MEKPKQYLKKKKPTNQNKVQNRDWSVPCPADPKVQLSLSELAPDLTLR